MSIANSVLAEYLFSGLTSKTSHKTMLSAIRKCIDADNGSLVYFPEISILYTFEDGSVAVVNGAGASSYDSVDEAIPALCREEDACTLQPPPTIPYHPARFRP